jgi:hypothetical protein
MADKYGAAFFLDALDVILEQCEAATRAKIRAIPNGTYQAEAFWTATASVTRKFRSGSR